MSINGRTAWLAGGALGTLLIVAASWLLFVHPKLSDADAARSDAAATRTSNDALRAKAATLRDKSEHLDGYRAALRGALAALPTDSGLPAFTRELTRAAAAHHVAVAGITVGGISAVDTAGTQTGTAPTGGTPTGGTPTGSTPTGTVQPPAASLYSIQVSLTADGSLAGERAFLKAVQYAGARRVLITSLAFTPTAGSAGASIDAANRLSAGLTVYTAPQSPAQQAQLSKLLAGAPGN